jgi:hypothetical protein
VGNLAKRPNAAPAVAAPPRLSHRLAAAIADLQQPHPDIAPPAAFAPAVIAEAAAALEALAPFSRPIAEHELAGWLRPLLIAVRNPPSADGAAVWVRAVHFACADLAAGALTEATQREAVQAFAFLPAAADVHRVLHPHSARIRAQARHLRQIAEGQPDDGTPRQPPTEAEHDAVRALAEQFRAERSWNRPGAQPTQQPARAAPIHPDHLAALRDSNPLVQVARLDQRAAADD